MSAVHGPGGPRAFLRQLGPLLRPYWSRQLEALVYMVFELVYGVALPLVTMYVVDHVIPSGDVRRLGLFVLALLGLFVVDTMVGMRRAYVSEWINVRMLLDLRTRVFEHLQRLPHRFFSEAQVGDLLARLFGDLEVVGRALDELIGAGLYLALRALVTAVALVSLSPLLGTLVLVVVPSFALGYLMLRTRLEQASYALQTLQGSAEAYTQENLSAQATVKAFGLERHAMAAFTSRLEAVLGASLRLTVLFALCDASVGLAISLGELVVLGVGSYLVMQGQLTLGTLLAFVGLLGALFQPVALLSNVGQNLQKASGALERLTEILDAPPEIADRPGARALLPLRHEVRLESVSFGYQPGRPVLRGLDLVVPAGSHVAIVGTSGGGKSTLVQLLLRFWDPDDGAVLFDGLDLRQLRLASVREQIGVVFQDTFIFDATLRDNIALGRPDATDTEIVAAARAAQIHEDIVSLPAGYGTLAGERGVRLSGGQCQRLAIARALLRNPPLLILDEPTGALDTQTERELLGALVTLARGRTTISITHRLSLAATADRIFVLDGGRLVEAGTHAELVNAGGLYQRLWREHPPLAEQPTANVASLNVAVHA